MPYYDDPYQKAADGLSDEDLGLVLQYEPLAKIPRDRVHWLWPGRLPRGKLVILDGDPDVGKSTLSLDLAARLTTGTPMPDGYVPPAPANVLHLQAEDGIADTIRPRFDAAGGDVNRFFVVTKGVPDVDDVGHLTYRMPELPSDLDYLAAVIEKEKVELVIVDPFVAFLPEWVNSHKDQQIRRALAPLAKMAEELGITVLLIRHLNKSSDAPALYRGGGSIGILAAARVVLVAGHDPDEEGRRLLASLKTNIAIKAETLAYRLIPNELYDCAEVAWQGTSKRTAAELLAAANRAPDADERSKEEEAVAFLFAELANGPKRAKAVLDSMREGGWTFAERTLERAKRIVGVIATKEDAYWYWSLPSPDELLE